ncbi:uncharacterized protein [Coffea arabica]|uniref:Uncharacterized protein n=1 Tax=Coffea arabica TaxID=13443 RepID=A0A6P6SKH8_COFAR|nr:uncharacterized protein LOC113692390 isoform X1 [Coffea arabica]
MPGFPQIISSSAPLLPLQVQSRAPDGRQYFRGTPKLAGHRRLLCGLQLSPPLPRNPASGMMIRLPSQPSARLNPSAITAFDKRSPLLRALSDSASDFGYGLSVGKEKAKLQHDYEIANIKVSELSYQSFAYGVKHYSIHVLVVVFGIRVVAKLIELFRESGLELLTSFWFLITTMFFTTAMIWFLVDALIVSSFPRYRLEEAIQDLKLAKFKLDQHNAEQLVKAS